MAPTSKKPSPFLKRETEIEQVFRDLELETAVKREAVLCPPGLQPQETPPVYYAIRVSGNADLAVG
jgi:hypothetical protein